MTIVVAFAPEMIRIGYAQRFSNYQKDTAKESRYCPRKCRCVDQDHSGLQLNTHTWQSQDLNKLKGTDIVCTGLSKVPRALSNGKLI